MTLPPHPDLPSDDEELDAAEVAVHAVLDGEADAEQRRRVASDPLLLARLVELRAVAERVATPPTPLPPALFDRLRAVALDRLHEEEGPNGAAPLPSDGDGRPSSSEDTERAPGAGDDVVISSAARADGMGPAGDDLAPVRPLAPRRSRRATARRLPPLPAVAAVVIVLLALGVSLLLAGRDRDEDLTAASGGRASADSAAEQEATVSADNFDAEDDAQVDEEAGAGAVETEESGTRDTGALEEEAAGDVGEPSSVPAFADEAALRDALQRVDPDSLVLDDPDGPASGTSAGDEVDPTTSARTRSTSPEAQRCSDVLQASDPAIGPTTAAAVVLVDGEELLVLTNEVMATADEPAATQLTVFDAVGCVPRLAVRR